jgi:hypothetical protein
MATTPALSRLQRPDETQGATEDSISASWLDRDEGELMRLDEYPADPENEDV